MAGRTVNAKVQTGETAVVADAMAKNDVARVLCALLPQGSQVVACWRDWSIGVEDMVTADADASAALRLRAEQSLWDRQLTTVTEPLTLLHAWSNAEGDARMAVAASLTAPVPFAQVVAWKNTARALIAAVLEVKRSQSKVVSLEKSKRVQQALYEITDLAGADLEMPEMLQRIHTVVASLMYAQNCYIVLYDDLRRTLRFLYFADLNDPYVAEPGREFSEEEMQSSMTVGLLRHGQPLRGPSSVVRQRLGLAPDPSHGPDSLDWLGVPMCREGRVCGAVVVQSYDAPASYSDEDRVLLSYVAQHILTALERRQAYQALESRVQARTQELELANRELQAEILERKRAERLQNALFRITELANASTTLDQFYAAVHAVVDELIFARNFYIALLDDDGQWLHFPYSVDERDQLRRSRQVGHGLTEHVIHTGVPLLADPKLVRALTKDGVLSECGPPALSWLGVPLVQGGKTRGCVVVQSYLPDVRYTVHDQSLLSFVAHHISNGLARQRVHESLRAAHLELERRVAERTFELAEANSKLVAQMGERLRAEQRLTHQANHDALTGLPNRAFLLARLAEAIERRHAGQGVDVTVLFLDLDRFKLVNDSMGHAAGDELLIKTARRIAAQLSESHLVARLGGDEFAVLICSDTAGREAMDLAECLQKKINQPVWIAGRELFPTASIGIAAWHPRYHRGEELLRDADAAMYRAKSQGRNRTEVFDQAMREAVMKTLDLEADLRRAINGRQFSPFYQPIVRLDDGKVIGHEALLRWHHEYRGLLLPTEFIALGEDSGLIEQVDWLIYEQVAQCLARGCEGYVSVNVSPRHFRSPDFAERLLALLTGAGANPAQLRVELTETALLDDAPRTLQMLELLRQHGVLAQLDDFGTGFSALSYLHQFPISTLKIDRSFVSRIGEQSSQESVGLICAIVALASTLGIQTVAEGVETQAQLQVLSDLGCDYAQGYLFGRPGPVLGKPAL